MTPVTAHNGAVTPAVRLLERSGVDHRVLSYEHDPSTEGYGTEAVEALGLAAEAVFKTLVAEVDGRPVTAVVPVAGRLDLKALARAAGAKRAAMADPTEAERLTGYVVGGISPLGQKRRLPVYVDESARALDVVYVSAGRRGVEIELAPDALATTAGGSFAPIAQ